MGPAPGSQTAVRLPYRTMRILSLTAIWRQLPSLSHPQRFGNGRVNEWYPQTGRELRFQAVVCMAGGGNGCGRRHLRLSDGRQHGPIERRQFIRRSGGQR